MTFYTIQIASQTNMRGWYADLAQKMLEAQPFDRGEVHAQRTTTPEMVTREVLHTTHLFNVPSEITTWAEIVEPNLPWADDHFAERVSGEPLNPAPSEAWWPYTREKNKVHKKDEKFSHTYPERFWPCGAGTNWLSNPFNENMGIRFAYGDLNDVVMTLNKNKRSRQAYLPIWFPEDTYAASIGERVPCTLGYHFLVTPQGTVDMTYSMRSCDMVRFYRDDVYLAGRLLQWMCEQIELEPGTLVVHIANLHTFMGDQLFLEAAANYDARRDYNFGAL